MKSFIATIILSSILSALANTEVPTLEKDCVAGNGLACAKADAVDVISTLPAKFKECAKKVVSNIKFPKPQGINPSYDYDLTIMSGE